MCVKCKKKEKSPKYNKTLESRKTSKQTNKRESEKATFMYSSHTYQRLHGCQRVRTPNKKSLAQQTRYG